MWSKYIQITVTIKKKMTKGLNMLNACHVENVNEII